MVGVAVMVAMSVPYAPERSKQAFLFSFVRLWDACGGKLYFWTFTPAMLYTDKAFARCWNRFFTRLAYYQQRHDFMGLRVFQRFKKGDLHVHMVCNQRFYVGVLRRLCCGTGMGKVLHVRKASADDAVYLSRYMSRDFAFVGVRDWAKLGDWEHTRGIDLVAGGADAAEFASLMVQFGGGQEGYCRARVAQERIRGARLGLNNYDGVTPVRRVDIAEVYPF